MKRIKRDRIKTEKQEPAAGCSGARSEHDLAYYIHDRVGLMQQVFSAIKYKDLKAMAPECVRNLPVGDLQELCTEELLGISSKRLLAVLDGAEPPSDTESSSASNSPTRMETISLDSISSDEEILSRPGKKKKHKHKRRDSKSKSKKRDKAGKQTDTQPDTQTEEAGRASRAGLTVLELLELQARARAIRAQLHNDQPHKTAADGGAGALDGGGSLSEGEGSVEIKEEAPDVVEISSEDEKPDPSTLEPPLARDRAKQPSPAKPVSKPTTADTPPTAAKPAPAPKEPPSTKSPTKETEETAKTSSDTHTDKLTTQVDSVVQPDMRGDKQTVRQTVTRRVSDLVITVPQPKTTRKIKLNRNKVTVSVPNVTQPLPLPRTVTIPPTDKDRKKTKKKKKRNVDKEGSDHDEITLQLSDSEKMDLLEDLNEKNYEKLSSSSADSDSDSSHTGEDTGGGAHEHEGLLKEKIQSSVVKVDAINGKEKSDSSRVENRMHSSFAKVINGKEKNDSGKVENKIQSSVVKVSDVTNGKEKSSNSDDCTDENKIQSSFNDDKEKSDSKVDKVQSALSNNDKMPSDEDNGSKDNDNENIQIPDDVEETAVEVTNEELNSEKDSEQVVEIIEDTVNLEFVTESLETLPDLATEYIEESNNETDLIENAQAKNTLDNELENESKDLETEKVIEIRSIEDIPVINEEIRETEAENEISQQSTGKKNDREVSEGELSDRESSEVEAFEVEPEVVCISDEEQSKKKKKKKDKKAKKAKKSKKKDFRERADQNFYKDADKLPPEVIENLGAHTNYTDTELDFTAVVITDDTALETIDTQVIEDNDTEAAIDLTDDEVYEILELSDDSSCYEVEGTVLSREPTTQEIEALLARIDQIKREDIEREENELGGNLDEDYLENDKDPQKDNKHDKDFTILHSENAKSDQDPEQEMYVSWKDRYLDSKKVKKVLTTSNILNALRKKNKDLKRKIEESKKQEREEAEREKEEAGREEEQAEIEVAPEPLEGSIEHYKTLQGSTKYVDPVKEDENAEVTKTNEEKTEPINTVEGVVDTTEAKIATKNTVEEETVTKAMKKEAKQLLKMYKKLLKYNDMTKQRDPHKKEKKKKKQDDKTV